MPTPWPSTPPSAADHASFRDAVVRPFWLDALPARAPHPPLEGVVETDLCVVGAGFTGLWAAHHAGRPTVVLEAATAGEGASGRNGGFVEASLTHGLGNGLARNGPAEQAVLERLARANLDGLRADLDRLDVDAAYEPVGQLSLALEPHELAELPGEAAELRRFGWDTTVLDRDAVQAAVASPTSLGAVWDRDGAALADPGKLVDGLRRTLPPTATLHEHSPVVTLHRHRAGVEVRTAAGAVRARHVLLALSAHPSPLRAVRRRVAPVYDYVLVSEPLTAQQRADLRWAGRQGLADRANRFHYYRLTPDDRLLFGGWDAVHRRGEGPDARRDDHEPTSALLAQHARHTFPQLEGLRWTHRWGGAIDTCSRFSVFFQRSHGGRAVSAAGFTGLGVGASRWAAQVALELLDGADTESTRLRAVRTRPVPFPPEPLRTAVIRLTQRELARADAHQGRRGPWLALLDRLGLGFGS